MFMFLYEYTFKQLSVEICLVKDLVEILSLHVKRNK